MTISNRDVQRQRREHEQQFEPNHTEKWGEIATVNGSTSPAGQPNRTYVDMYKSGTSVLAVWNDTMLSKAGTPVQLGNDPKPPGIKIVGPYTKGEVPNSTVDLGRFNTPPHGPSHQYLSEAIIGDDPALIYQPAIQMLKTTGNGVDLTVSTQAYGRFPGADTDMTADIPAVAGQVRRVLVYYDRAQNKMTTIQGTAVLDNGVIPVPYPEVPENATASAYIRLANGQTSISTVNHVEDARDFLDSGSALRFEDLVNVADSFNDGEVPIYDADNNEWIGIAVGGTGDVVGPASATDHAVARFDTGTGKLLQDSLVLVGDAGAVTGVTSLTISGTGTALTVDSGDLTGSGIISSLRGFRAAASVITEIYHNGTANTGNQSVLALPLNTDTTKRTAVQFVGGFTTITDASRTSTLAISTAVGGTFAQRLGIGTSGQVSIPNIDVTGGAITGITDLAVADGGTGASTAVNARTNLGLAIGSNVQAWDDDLDDLAALTPTKGNVIVGNGTDWIALGVGTDTHVITADAAEATGVKWAAQTGGSGTPGGSDGQVQYNNGGAFGGSEIYWDDTNGRAGVGTGSPAAFFEVQAGDVTGHSGLIAVFQGRRAGTNANVEYMHDGDFSTGNEIVFNFPLNTNNASANQKRTAVGMHASFSNITDASRTSTWQIKTAHSGTFATRLSLVGNKFGFGSTVTNPQGKIHGHDGTGGFLFWTHSAVSTTAVTVVPNGTGDVTAILRYRSASQHSGGHVNTLDGGIGLSTSVQIHSTGSEFLNLRVNADGSVDIFRSSGSGTFKVALWLTWI